MREADQGDCSRATFDLLLYALPNVRAALIGGCSTEVKRSAASHEREQSPIRAARIARMAGSNSRRYDRPTFAISASLTVGDTNSVTSPPRVAISLTSVDEMKV